MMATLEIPLCPTPTRARKHRRRRYARLTSAEREWIAARLATTDNITEIAREVGVDRKVVRRVRDELEQTGRVHQRRLSWREGFVDEIWEAMLLALQTVKDGLVNGYVTEDRDIDGRAVNNISRVSPAEAAQIVCELYRTLLLAEGRTPSVNEQIAGKMTEEQLIAEVARLEAEVERRKGRLQ